MAIKANFTRRDVELAFKNKAKQIDAAIVNRFILVGETFVNNARRNGQYQDQTGNLRSGISYIVFHNGVKRSPGSISEFTKKLMDELRLKYLTGYVLIVATGLNYAAAVESRGKDVLTGSSQKAKSDLEKAFKSLTKGV